MDPGYRRLLADTVIVTEPAASTGTPDLYGRVTLSTATASTYRCRYTENRRTFRVGEETVDEIGRLVIDSTTRFTPGATFELSDGSKPPVLSVSYPADENGLHHVVVVLGARG